MRVSTTRPGSRSRHFALATHLHLSIYFRLLACLVILGRRIQFTAARFAPQLSYPLAASLFHATSLEVHLAGRHRGHCSWLHFMEPTRAAHAVDGTHCS